ncbi:hypothetical protein JCM11641_004908 [Rhodosporidiobolus odoratus]
MLLHQFLERLAELFAKQKEKGSVFITQKRYTHEATIGPSTSAGDGEEDVEMSEQASGQEREWPLFLRATDGDSKKDTKVKISTIVQPADYDSFIQSYHALLRSTFSTGLRPKRKKTTSAKAAKRKAKAGGNAAASAGGAAGDSKGAFSPRLPKVVGPRRGNGVKKRRRLEKRREKAVARLKAIKSRKSIVTE